MVQTKFYDWGSDSQPEDPYGISKYAVELDLKAAHEMFDLNYVILRPQRLWWTAKHCW